MTALMHTWFMTVRHLRALMRQPWWIAISLVQPITYLLLYGQVFSRIVELPGFHAPNYVTYVTPGIVIMMALFGGGWNGMGIIAEIDRGVMDRFLVAPVSRAAIIAGRLVQMSIITVVQAAMMLGLGWVLGARFEGGFTGLAVLMLCAVLVALPFGALSNAMALVIRRQESVIGASNFILLPMTFLSPVFMAPTLMPRWVQRVSLVNPVAWSVETARSALSAHADWRLIGTRLVWLAALGLASAWLAARAFRSYQKSI
ncbi:MAG: multidrug ABC transporter permease [Acidobacteria bacterium]|nr:MAG: multidrug ABC transporter permease [Acidobacteriota bacterium]